MSKRARPVGRDSSGQHSKRNENKKKVLIKIRSALVPPPIVTISEVEVFDTLLGENLPVFVNDNRPTSR